VFALRGDGASKFLGIAPLEFHPEPGTWYTLRAVAAGDRLQVYLNEEAVPRINIRDDDAM
jgi:beta-galactosidase